MNTCIHSHMGELIMATSVRLKPDVEARLDALAKQTGRTKAYYIRERIWRIWRTTTVSMP